MVGDFSVGKTSLIRCYVEGKFDDRYLSTVGVKISRRNLDLPSVDGADPQAIQLIIWDLEGQTKFKAIAPTYLQGSRGTIIVADISRPETIDSIKGHIELYRSVSQDGAIVIALNKTDLFEPQKSQGILDQLKQTYQADIIEAYSTSAKSGQNVESLFIQLAAATLK
ncbi:MAG: GTP-binding protein [Coleofasciculaceae cyanobacterium RL_1_1]|nr:GTP-binding protein [Coleofasciculaceae cyanobacterium RL_1_1]